MPLPTLNQVPYRGPLPRPRTALAAALASIITLGVSVGVANETESNAEPRNDERSEASAPTTYDAPISLDLTFVFHIDDDLAEQDVYIERVPGSGKVFRPTKAERNLDQPIYAAASEVEHAPFETDNLGPFDKGRPLGMTLGDWFAAKGAGKYTCTGGQGRIEVDFEHLARDSAYTFWHTFYAWPPTEPFIGTYDLPVGARDGSESVFRSDSEGSATVVREFTPCLQLGGEHLLSDVAISLHSDGSTHGHHPGPFGYTSHVQLYAALPQRAGL